MDPEVSRLQRLVRELVLALVFLGFLAVQTVFVVRAKTRAEDDAAELHRIVESQELAATTAEAANLQRDQIWQAYTARLRSLMEQRGIATPELPPMD